MLNSFNKRVQRINFAMNPDSIVKDIMSVLVKGPINQKKLDLFKDYLFMGNEWNLSKKFIESDKGKEWIKKISDAYKSVIDKLIYDYILTDDYFLFVNDTKEYNKLMELIYGPEEAKFQSYSPDINYFVGGIWDGNDSDLQGSGKDVNKAIEDYNKNCNLYLKEGYLQVVHRWEGKSAKGKVKAIPPQVTPEQVISGKYNFSKVDIEKCLDAMSEKQLNNPEEAIGLLMIKFKLSKEDAERYYHGYCGDKEFSNRVKKCFGLAYDNIVYHVVAKVGDEVKYDECISYEDARKEAKAPVGNPLVVREIYLRRMGLEFNNGIDWDGVDFGTDEYYKLSKKSDELHAQWEKDLRKKKVVIKIKKVINGNGKIMPNLNPEDKKAAENYLKK